MRLGNFTIELLEVTSGSSEQPEELKATTTTKGLKAWAGATLSQTTGSIQAGFNVYQATGSLAGATPHSSTVPLGDADLFQGALSAIPENLHGENNKTKANVIIIVQGG
jgi:hypothetical protein|tara:strand:+ start:175 stop:501 length:327 start_codon:yes stop_codon:yes gene_type:complete